MSAFRRHPPIITGEATPSYLFFPQIPGRVAELIPNVKLIVLLRDPVTRAYSQYQHNVRMKKESRPFDVAIEEETLREPTVEGRGAKAYRQSAYAARGRYQEQIEQWLKVFPREQMLLLSSETMLADVQRTYDTVLAFLGLAPWTVPQTAKYQVGGYDTEMPASAKAKLTEYFAPYNIRLRETYGIGHEWLS